MSAPAKYPAHDVFPSFYRYDPPRPQSLVTWRVFVDFGEGGSMHVRRAKEAEAREAFDDFCASDLAGHVQLFRVVAGVDELIAEAFVSALTAEAV